jgi:hypothetical protein
MKTRKFLRAAKRSTRRNVPAASRKLADRISRTPPTPLQIVSSMYAYLMTSWEELPDENKRALGFDFVVGSEGEEKALNHLARLLWIMRICHFVERCWLGVGGWGWMTDRRV